MWESSSASDQAKAGCRTDAGIGRRRRAEVTAVNTVALVSWSACRPQRAAETARQLRDRRLTAGAETSDGVVVTAGTHHRNDRYQLGRDAEFRCGPELFRPYPRCPASHGLCPRAALRVSRISPAQRRSA